MRAGGEKEESRRRERGRSGRTGVQGVLASGGWTSMVQESVRVGQGRTYGLRGFGGWDAPCNQNGQKSGVE